MFQPSYGVQILSLFCPDSLLIHKIVPGLVIFLGLDVSKHVHVLGREERFIWFHFRVVTKYKREFHSPLMDFMSSQYVSLE